MRTQYKQADIHCVLSLFSCNEEFQTNSVRVLRFSSPEMRYYRKTCARRSLGTFQRCYYEPQWNWHKNFSYCSHSTRIMFDGFCGFKHAFSLPNDGANGTKMRKFNYYRMKSLMKYATRNHVHIHFKVLSLVLFRWLCSIVDEPVLNH